MEFLFLLMIFGGLGIAAYAMFANRGSQLGAGKQPKQLAWTDPLAERSGGDREFWLLKAGDLVKQITGTDFLVRRSVSLNDGGYRWNEHLLDDAAGNRKWLSVEDDEGLDLGLWEPLAEGDIEAGAPADRIVTARGIEFKLKESGTAAYQYATPDGEQANGNTDYFQYESDQGKMLAYQRYDNGRWEASIGDRVEASDFEIFPSSEAPTEKGQ